VHGEGEKREIQAIAGDSDVGTQVKKGKGRLEMEVVTALSLH
jgi:hypothetical protein